MYLYVEVMHAEICSNGIIYSKTMLIKWHFNEQVSLLLFFHFETKFHYLFMIIIAVEDLMYRKALHFY